MQRPVTTFATALSVFAVFALIDPRAARAQTAPLTPLPAPSVEEPASAPMVPDEPAAGAPPETPPGTPPKAHGEAPAEKRVERARFGERGQYVLSTYSSLGITSSKYAASDASYFDIDVGPSVDFFFEKNISLGLTLSGEYSEQQGYGSDSSLVQTTRKSFGGGLRLGVNIPFGDWFSLYPLLSLYATTTTSSQELVSGKSISVASFGTPADGTENSVRASIYAPLLAHLAPGFFVGFGPSFARDLARKNEGLAYQNLSTGFGASAIVGGFFGGERR